MRNSTRLKELILVVVSVGLAFGAGEMIARKFLPHPYKVIPHHLERSRGMPRLAVDPVIGWVNSPEDGTYHFNATGPLGTTDAVYRVRNGLRVSSAETAAGPVVIAAGCSFTFGVGLNDEDTWPWLLQERMNGARVLNAGTNNYGTIQSVMLADRLIAQMNGQVKGVVIGAAQFHLERDQASQALLFNAYPTGRPRWLLTGGDPKNAPTNRGLVYFWAPGTAIQRSDLLMTVINRVADISNKTPSYEGSRDITVAVVRDFTERCRRKGIAVAVVMLPNFGDEGAREKRDTEYLAQNFQKGGIPVFRPDFPRLPNGSLERSRFMIRSDGFHPTREYNVRLADGLAPFLKSRIDVHTAGANVPQSTENLAKVLN